MHRFHYSGLILCVLSVQMLWGALALNVGLKGLLSTARNVFSAPGSFRPQEFGITVFMTLLGSALLGSAILALLSPRRGLAASLLSQVVLGLAGAVGVIVVYQGHRLLDHLFVLPVYVLAIVMSLLGGILLGWQLKQVARPITDGAADVSAPGEITRG